MTMTMTTLMVTKRKRRKSTVSVFSPSSTQALTRSPAMEQEGWVVRQCTPDGTWG